MFKQHLEGKYCKCCGRYFQWRKRWRNNWPNVQYCSKACAAKKSQSA